MALALIATPGAVDANSYTTLAFAGDYHQGHPRAAAWTAGEAEQQVWALIEATRRLDAIVTWKGEIASETQRLLWPRRDVEDKRGVLIPESVIPEALQQATAEFARQLLEDDRLADEDIARRGLRRLRAGPVELEFSGQGEASVIPDAALALIAHLMEPLGRRVAVPLLRS